MRRALALVVAAACAKGSATPVHQLRFRGDAKAVAAAPGGGAVVAGEFAERTDLGAGALVTGDQSVHGVVAWIDRDGRIAWQAMLAGPFVHGIAADGDDVVLVAEAEPENRAWRLGPGGGEKWSVPFGGLYPRAGALGDDGTLYVVGDDGIGDASTGALAFTPIEERGWIAAIDRAGKVRWAKPFEAAADRRSPQAVAVAGDRVYAISMVKDAAVVDAYDRGGARVATRSLPSDGMGASITRLGDGVAIASGAGDVIALDRALAIRWERRLPLGVDAIAAAPGGIFVGGNSDAIEWNGATYRRANEKSRYAYVARLTLDGDPDWISVGRGDGEASTLALAASDDVVWGAGSFNHGNIVFGLADPLTGEPDGIESGFAIELKQAR